MYAVTIINSQPMKRLFNLIGFILVSSALIGQNGLNFDGVNDRVSCGNNPSTQIAGTTITLEAWIYPTAWQAQVWQGNILNKENNSPDYGYMLRCGESGKLNFNLGNGSWTEITSAANTLTLNTWQHVAATYNGAKMVLYLNGVAIDSINTTISFSSAGQILTLGNWSNISTDRTFIGTIDEARVWNVARTKSQINSAMNAELCASEPGLVACYRLNEGVAGASNTGVNVAYDFSPNNNNATLTGFQLSGSNSNWVSGAALTPGSSFSQVSANACNQYVGPGGVIYDSAGVYLDTLQTIHGCDSVIETTLTVKYVDVGVTATSIILSANQINASYKWMDCNDGFKLVSGGTNKSLVPPDPNGSYAVRVDFGGCIDTSACYSLVGIGLVEISEYEISVYPSPVNGSLTVFHPMTSKGHISIINLQGAVVLQTVCDAGDQTNIDLSALPGGVYFMMLESSDNRLVLPIAVEM